jgi:hypothetical protein
MRTIRDKRLIFSCSATTESIDGKKSYDAPPHSKEMTELNKEFGKLHGISTVVNLAGLAATIAYGVVLGKRLW